MTEDQLREMLREMRDDPAPEDSLRRVRMAVAERTQARQPFWKGWWPYAAVAAGAVAILTMAVWWPRPRPAPASAPVAVVRPGPVAPVPPRVEAELAPARTPQVKLDRIPARRAGRPDPRPAAPPRMDMLIRIETPDPNVVILLVGD